MAIGENENRRHRLCVFCASSTGVRAAHREQAETLGRLLAEAGIGLVYGGGQIGLMGVVADAALECGGEVIGVIPRSLAVREIAHCGLTRLDIVETMHERKAAMASESDAFAALPGGFGTLDEFFEAVTWTQLGIHAKPCILINSEGYYDKLLGFLDGAVAEGMLKPESRSLIHAVSSAAEAVALAQEFWKDLPIRREAPAAPAP